MPPAWMWHLDEELEEHFEKVAERRKSGKDRDDDDHDGPMMVRNEYARGRGRELAV